MSDTSGTPDGSTNISDAEKKRTDALPDGSGTDASEGDAEQDVTSGGAPDEPTE